MSGPSSTSRVVEVQADGTVVLEVTVHPAAPAPVDPPPLGAVKGVRIGTATYPVDVVDPTAQSNPLGAIFDGFRGPDQLVVYTAHSGPVTTTNTWGIERAVDDGTVVAVPAREIPRNGYVLSGHRNAAAWLARYAVLGATVELLDTAPVVTEPVPPVVTQPTSGRTVAVYMMDGVGRISQVPPEVNQVRIAFLQGSGLVEWGGDSPAQTAAAVTAWRQADPSRRVLISLGGEHGSVNLASVPAAIAQVARTMPVDGIDWDIEGGALDVAAAVRISRELAAGRPGWITSFVPPGGSPVPVYLDAAKQCQAAGLRVEFGQQLYETRVDEGAVLGALARAVGVLGAPSVQLGCMIGTDPARYSTNAQWAQYMRAALARWPDLGGAYLWESARAGTAQWAKDMRAALG